MDRKKRMAAGFAAAAVLTVLLAGTAAHGVQAAAKKAGKGDMEPSPEWVAGLEQAEDAEQLLVVAGIGETTAYVSMHEKDGDGAWNEIMTTPGFIGKKGLGKEKEGDAKTPVGTFSFNRAFGIAEDPGCAIPYQQVTENDYWSGDTREGYRYNEMVSIEEFPDLNTEDSEHLIEYTNQYQYCLNISYNEEGTPGLGSAIFLHCLGPIKPYTGGCVAIPKDKMLTVMEHVREDCVVVIDSLENISPELYEEFGLAPEEPAEEAGEDETAAGLSVYESKDGWSVRYDPETIEVTEEEDGAAFVYTGDASGTCMAEIRTFPEKGPQEVLGEVTADWGDPEKIIRMENYLPGGDPEHWGFCRVLETEKEGSGISISATAGEYNGGTILIEETFHEGSDDKVDIAANDAISELTRSITFEDFQPQEMFANYPGTYVREYTEEIEGKEQTFESRLVLNPDHMGTYSVQDDVEVLWGSDEINDEDGNSIPMTIEGDNLYLEIDGEWTEFHRVAEEEETEAAEETAAPEEGTEAAETGYTEYESPDGWAVRYDPELIEVTEEEDGAAFVYTGEAPGTCMTEIRTIPEKGPQEVLGEVTEDWGDPEKILRMESYFPGGTGAWGFWRVLPAEEEGSGLTITAIAAEYNGSTLLMELTTHLSGDDAIDMAVSDTLSELINNITYKEYAPQEMFSYYPGTYVREYTEEIEGKEYTFESRLVLNPDHTGIYTAQDDVDVLWSSNEIIYTDGSASSMDIEGDYLYLLIDDEWIEFQRAEEAEAAEETAEAETAETEEVKAEEGTEAAAGSKEAAAAEAEESAPETEDGMNFSDDASDFVLVGEAVPDAILEIRYYGTYNFVGERIDGYEEPVALLTKEAAAALREVSDDLAEKGYRLKIWDAYRPQKAVTHFMDWALDPDDVRMKEYFYPELEKNVLFPQGYIAEHSGHSRGSTVDLTLFDMRTEKEVDMGGTFDYFGELSHPDYKDITEEQYANRMILRDAMMAHGFRPLPEEWWHFTLEEEPYPDTYFTFPVNSNVTAGE